MDKISNKIISEDSAYNTFKSSINKIKTECKIKFSEWGSFESIGNSFLNFNDLIEFLSLQFYPNNFSVNFYDITNGELSPIGCNNDYNKILKNENVNNSELLLIVYIIPQEKNIKQNAQFSSNVNLRNQIHKKTEKCK